MSSIPHLTRRRINAANILKTFCLPLAIAWIPLPTAWGPRLKTFEPAKGFQTLFAFPPDEDRPLAASIPRQQQLFETFSPPNDFPIFISPNFNVSRTSTFDMLMQRATTNVERLMNERAKSDYDFVLQQIRHISANEAMSPVERIFRACKEVADWATWRASRSAQGYSSDAVVYGRTLPENEDSTTREWSNIYFESDGGSTDPHASAADFADYICDENDGDWCEDKKENTEVDREDEESSESSPFELVDTVIAGRWRRRRRGSVEEFYFDGSTAEAFTPQTSPPSRD